MSQYVVDYRIIIQYHCVFCYITFTVRSFRILFILEIVREIIRNYLYIPKIPDKNSVPVINIFVL